MSAVQEINVAAVLQETGKPLKIVNRDIPTPGPDELVVRNYAIAANPVDWKLQGWGFEPYPTVLGSDGCGVVSAIGSSVTKFKVGDRVTGFATVITNKSPDHGAWQTYEILKEISATKIPDFMSFEEGSTFPMAFATSAIAFYGKLDLPRPGDKVQAQQNGLLIWGASSSVGTAGIQLARASGYKVFATASPQHHDFLKSLGAFAVFDYKDPEVTLKIVAAAKSAGTPITVAYDTISENGSSELTADTLLASGGKGGRMVITLPYAGKEGIDVVMTIAGHVSTEHADVGEWLFNEYLTKALENKSIVPAPKIEIVEGGIPAAQKVFDQLKAGVSGKKLVVKVD